MAVKYRPYPAYKPSGVEWLGDIPEGWNHAPIKYMALEEQSLFLDGDWIESKDLADDGIRYITTGNVGEGAYKEQGGGYISEETFKKINASEVFEGDILVSRLNPPIGRACMVPDLLNRIVTSVDNVIFRPDTNFNRSFVVYMLSSREYFDHTSNMARGATMQRISRGLLGNIRIVFPPLPQQTKIVTFLDHETSKIDSLIAKQQRLIALLEEKRQAVISHAVTKGLDPTAPLRPSGIDWLGDVPAHWEVKRLKYLCLINTGNRNTEDAKEDGNFPFFVRSQTIERINSAPYNCEAILTAGDGAGVGKVYHYINGQFDCHQRVYMLTDFEELSGKFIFEYLENNFFNVALAGQAKSTVDSLRMPVFLNFEVTVPPNYEQNAIVDYIAKRKTTFANLSKQVEAAIALLKERRTALISAAVTGKIDLRDWQAPEAAFDNPTLVSNQPEEALP